MENIVIGLLSVTILATGIVAGIFFAFSNFVMAALSKIPDAEGMAAMQSINVVVLNKFFLGLFMGAVGLCLLVCLVTATAGTQPQFLLALAGTILYGGGTVALTGTRNVPLNKTLAPMNPLDKEAQYFWRDYCEKWTYWNSVRTLASSGACVCFSIVFYLF